MYRLCRKITISFGVEIAKKNVHKQSFYTQSIHSCCDTIQLFNTDSHMAPNNSVVTRLWCICIICRHSPICCHLRMVNRLVFSLPYLRLIFKSFFSMTSSMWLQKCTDSKVMRNLTFPREIHPFFNSVR